MGNHNDFHVLRKRIEFPASRTVAKQLQPLTGSQPHSGIRYTHPSKCLTLISRIPPIQQARKNDVRFFLLHFGLVGNLTERSLVTHHKG